MLGDYVYIDGGEISQLGGEEGDRRSNRGEGLQCLPALAWEPPILI